MVRSFGARKIGVEEMRVGKHPSPSSCSHKTKQPRVLDTTEIVFRCDT